MSFRLEARLGRVHPDAFTVLAIVGAYAMAGVLIGYVIATGRPVPIALTLGVIAGVALLNALPLVVWTILVGVLVISGPVVMFVPDLEKATWLFSLLGFFLVGAALLYPAVGRDRFVRPLPGFVVLAILVLAYGVFSIAYSGGTLAEGVRASKRYFQFYGLLFILSVVPFATGQVRRWWGSLVVLAALQLPFVIYQVLVLVPMREGLSIPGLVPIDIVVGTMEGSLTGGGSSSVLALLAVLALVFLLALYRDGLLPMRRLLLLGALVSAPLVLGETHIVIVLLPIALAVLYSDLIRRRPMRVAVGAALFVPVLVLLAYGYLVATAEPGQSLDQMIEEVISYNFGSRGYFGTGLNRTTVYPYWLEQHGQANLVQMVFGHGIGSSFGNGIELDSGHKARAHPWMFIGLTAASAVLWDLGLVGLMLFVGLLYSAVLAATRLTSVAAPGFDRAFCRSLQVAAAILAVMLFYSDAMISVPSLQVLTMLVLGLVAWRIRVSYGPLAWTRNQGRSP
jgi:hypothetical protein